MSSSLYCRQAQAQACVRGKIVPYTKAMHKVLLDLGLLLLPSLAFGAGFAKHSIFLSKNPVTEGDTVLIHTVVQNDLTPNFAGQLVIRAGEAAVGSVPVVLEAGEVQAVSVSWKPAAGSHKVAAELQDKEGKVVESTFETFTIKEKPSTAPKASQGGQTAAAVESSAGIQEQIGSISPAAQGAAAPVFRLVDSGREAIADVIDTQLINIKPKVAQNPLPGVVGGAETIKAPDEQSWFWSIVYTVYFYILTVLRYLVGSAVVFYPLLMILFLFILWRGFKRFRRA